MRIIALTTLALSFALAGACTKKNTVDPDKGSNLVGNYGGSNDGFDEDEMGLGDEGGFEDLEDDGSEVAVSELPPLPERAKPVKKCKGKGKNRTCGMTDPKPKVSAAYGIRVLMGDYRWGMSPKDVFKLLSREIEAEYEAKQKKAEGDAMAQDNARSWRQQSLQELKANHIKFTKASKHRWGVSLIQYEYEDDAQEEMLYIKANTTLRKFYFFKNGELWKIFYAYGTDSWPGESYADVVENRFKKWFGISPEEKVKQDPETAAPLIRYYEWESQDGDIVRSFDLTQVHGVMGLAVIDKEAEERMGERLPNVGRDDKYTDVVNDVLGDSELCYDESGQITTCPTEK